MLPLEGTLNKLIGFGAVRVRLRGLVLAPPCGGELRLRAELDLLLFLSLGHGFVTRKATLCSVNFSCLLVSSEVGAVVMTRAATDARNERGWLYSCHNFRYVKECCECKNIGSFPMSAESNKGSIGYLFVFYPIPIRPNVKIDRNKGTKKRVKHRTR